jgi:hypothetical protein
MGVTAGIVLASILLKEMRYLVYIRYLWGKCTIFEPKVAHFPRVILKYSKFANFTALAIFFVFYNISQPNFAILLILGCSFELS